MGLDVTLTARAYAPIRRVPSWIEADAECFSAKCTQQQLQGKTDPGMCLPQKHLSTTPNLDTVVSEGVASRAKRANRQGRSFYGEPEPNRVLSSLFGGRAESPAPAGPTLIHKQSIRNLVQSSANAVL